MYKVNRGLKEWQLEPNLFYLRFLEVCNTFNINTFDVEE